MLAFKVYTIILYMYVVYIAYRQYSMRSLLCSDNDLERNLNCILCRILLLILLLFAICLLFTGKQNSL